jgi:hypothetical protein
MPRGVVIFWLVVLLLIVGFTAWLIVLPDMREGVGLGVIRSWGPDRIL